MPSSSGATRHLTDGRRLHLSDFGLLTARRFQLDAAEQRHFRLTADHDLACAATALVSHIVGTLIGFESARERNDYVRRCADSDYSANLGGAPADAVVRYAGIAAVVNDFYWQRHAGKHAASHPADVLAASLERAGLLAYDDVWHESGRSLRQPPWWGVG